LKNLGLRMKGNATPGKTYQISKMSFRDLDKYRHGTFLGQAQVYQYKKKVNVGKEGLGLVR
jgi:hypothetical protein